MSEEGKNYELLYIVPNQYTESELKDIKEKVEALLTKSGAVLGYQEFLGKKKLAYPINKVAHGYYLVVEFELADPSILKEITNFLRLDKQILRSQIIIKKKITNEEIARQKREAQEERAEPAREKSVEEKPARKAEVKKPSFKNLDEKLDEILKTDDLV